MENHTIHSVAPFYDYCAYPTNGNCDGGPVNFLRTPEDIQNLYKQLYTPGQYADAHGFVYTPSSLAFLVSYAQRIGLLTLGDERVVLPPQGNFEFLAVLSKTHVMDQESLKNYALNMVSEAISCGRSYPHLPDFSTIPLHRLLYDRFRDYSPAAAKILAPAARARWRLYKKLK